MKKNRMLSFMAFTLFMSFMSSFSVAQITEAPTILVRIETPLGNIDLAIDTKRAPVTSANFLKYVDAGLYNGGRFHRATRPDNYTPTPPNRPAMELIQGGINPDRRNDGFPAIPLERTSVTGIKHVAGVVSMARVCRRYGHLRLLHPARRPAVARPRRHAVRRWSGCRGVWPGRRRAGRRPEDSAAASREAGADAAGDHSQDRQSDEELKENMKGMKDT